MASASARGVPSADLKAVLDLIVDRACSVLGARRGGLALVETQPGGPLLTFAAFRGMSSRFPERVRPKHWREGTTPTAVAEMRPVWSADILHDPAYDISAEMRSAVEAEGYRAVLSVPLVVVGTALGALAIYRDTPGPFSVEEVAQLQAFADQAAVAIDNARRAESAQGRLAQL